ncbi:YkvA family protein [Pontibacter liquoris]|uniref:YkvA family protein n=1 Tax=Pontibacter liquoris TaxID=2905677 RepID=UPI001FA79279|nr:YkvA family protein [Pontibacter liquoris]
MAQLHTLKQKAQELNIEIYTLYLASRDSRVKWYVRLLLALAIGYGISPIDLVPDLTPVFGFLDDVVIVTLGVSVCYQLLSRHVIGQARLQAYEVLHEAGGSTAAAHRVIGYTWVLMASLLLILGYKLLFMHLQ